MLELQDLSKRFGGVVANDAVTLRVAQGEVHALIGPNGAGKTTLIGQIVGRLRPDAGRITFLGADITAQPQHERVRAGLACSHQITSVFGRFTVLDNLALAVQARSGSSFSFWRPVRSEVALFDQARELAQQLGLGQRLHVSAAALAHGEQRVLEVGLALATQPKFLLLDEPLAGMGEEGSRLIELVDRIRKQVTVLLVEHDMDAVFRLADRISVLVAGRIIATGTPEQVRRNPAVMSAYLGNEASCVDQVDPGRCAGPPQARPDPRAGSIAVPGERGAL
jgi:branched-chain amino acid transport system ATP-binding protein